MYKSLADSTLKKQTKEWLIEKIRCAEHNRSCEYQRAELLSMTLQKLTDGLIADGILTKEEVIERLDKAQKPTVDEAIKMLKKVAYGESRNKKA